MRFLGFLFLVALVLAGVGYFRGWFSVSTAHAGGASTVTLGVDNDKISDDTKAAGAGLGKLSAKAAEKVRSLGRDVGAQESELEGTLTAVDPAARNLSVMASSQTIDLHVPTTVSIRRDGESVGFEQLHAATRAKFTFKHSGEDRSLSRIEVLH